MFSKIRKSFGPLFVGLIIGFIAFVFIFYGIFNPKATRGIHEGAVAGLVNGEKISLSEFNRAYEQRLEMFKSFGGGKLTDQQLKMFRVRESTFDSLVERKVLVQQSRELGLIAGDEQVRSAMREMAVFRNAGGFDPLKYEQVLRANRYSPASFEQLIRDDLSVQALQSSFRDKVRISEAELKAEFLRQGEKRELKYVLLTTEMGRKRFQIPSDEVQKFLADEKNLNLLKGQYEREKDTTYRGKDFEKVKASLAEAQVARSKSSEIRALNEKIADEVAGLLTAEPASDAKVQAMFKDLGATVKSTGLVPRSQSFIQGLGDTRDLFADAFSANAPIDSTRGGKAKRYSTPAGIVVAVVVKSESADESKLPSERNALLKQLIEQKQREFFSGWMKSVKDQAKIEKNPDVVSPGEDEKASG